MKGRPLEFLLLLFAGWVNRRQLDVIDYLRANQPRSSSKSTRTISPTKRPTTTVVDVDQHAQADAHPDVS